MLKPGGTLVNTPPVHWNRRQNQQNLEWFLQKHPDFSLSSLKPYASAAFAESELGAELESGQIQLPAHNSHGLFGLLLSPE